MSVRIRALWLCVLLAAAPGASAQLFRTVDAGGGLYLQQVFARALIREPSGDVGELALPRGASLSRLERLSAGWIAAGVVDTPESTDLFLLQSDEGARKPFPTPPNDAAHPLRSDPVPLVERGRLVGLAWLAGSGVRQTAVYASFWSGLDWSQAEVVSPVGPGTQIALAGTVLVDGSWLLVWSAYDGNDDDILWSRRVGQSWSAPRPLHLPNETADIVPAIVGTGRGALAAWSWFDGGTYRVKLAGFEDGAWRPLDLVGPAGSVRPSLTARGDGALLLYRTVVPPTWTLVELDERGAPLRRAVVEKETTFRPGLAPWGGRRSGFEWPGADVATPLRVETEWQPEP